MKKLLLLIFLISFNVIIANAQNCYYDAFKLKPYIKTDESGKFILPENVEVYKILANYIDNPTVSTIKDVFSDNPFITFQAGGSHDDKLIQTNPTKSFSSIDGLDVTTIADGFAKFIVKRTKHELSIAFFDKFKKELDSIKDIQTVFPQTYRTLSAIGEEIYMYQAYIQSIRESFEKDLASLPSNLPSIIENHEEYFNKMPEFKAGLNIAFYLSQAIQNKQHPGEIIENFPVDTLNSVNPNIKAAFQTLQLFSNSLKSDNDSTYWVSNSEIKKLSADSTLLKIYLGLILQQARKDSIIFIDKKGDTTSLATKMNDWYKLNKDLKPYKTFITNLATKTQALENKIKSLKKTVSDSLLFENYYSVISSTIDLMRYAVKVEKLPFLTSESLNLEEKTKPYFDLSQAAADIAIDINRRNYASAIVNTVYMYDLVISKWNISDKECKEAKEKIKNVITNNLEQVIKTGFIPKTITLTNKQLNELQPYIDKLHYNEIYKKYFINNDAINDILKYGSLMATIAQAKSSDDVAAAIEAVALPTGSARIKRESSYNVSLNAYCGIFGGQDRADLKRSSPIYSYGITAPIGITSSWGCKHNSFSLFLSIFDIGAVTAFRFVDDTATIISKIQLKEIISPGFFLSYGIPKSPISLNFGCQISPMLKSVSSSGISLNDRLFRVTLGVCVDLPLLNLYTKSK